MNNNKQISDFNYLEGHRYISLTTFYKNGRGVATPVEFAIADNDKIFVSTRKNSYKVKRIRVNDSAVIAPCTMRGKIVGQKMNCKVRILPKEEEQEAMEQLAKLYTGLIYKIMFKLFFWRKKEERVYLEIVPSP